MQQTLQFYDSFVEFMEAVVIPRRPANPDDIRLDGREHWESNPENAGYFHHLGKEWTVRGNTRYEPLMLAYDAIMKGETSSPFEEERNKEGNLCLILLDNIRLRKACPDVKHMYIYHYGA
jgi:hypothetical protein